MGVAYSFTTVVSTLHEITCEKTVIFTVITIRNWHLKFCLYLITKPVDSLETLMFQCISEVWCTYLAVVCLQYHLKFMIAMSRPTLGPSSHLVNCYWGYRGQDMIQATTVHRITRLKIGGAIPPLPHMTSWHAMVQLHLHLWHLLYKNKLENLINITQKLLLII